jgi:hypothetical protein
VPIWIAAYIAPHEIDMTDSWDELDALCEELHGLDAEAAERRAHLAAELESMRPVLDLLDRHDTELAPAAALEAVRTRLLSGAGVIQRTAAAFGLDRLLVLAWPAGADPRPDLSSAAGEYRVEVWLGLNEQGRARVRVIGAKRMEATLPVPLDRFRAVLLNAVRAPAFTPYPATQDDEARAESEPSSEPATDAEESTPPPGTVDTEAASTSNGERGAPDPD